MFAAKIAMFDSKESDFCGGNRNALLHEETTEWVKLNISLREHGLIPISFLYQQNNHAHEHDETNKYKDHILITLETLQNVRKAIQVLMKDSNRRQDLVQDMITTNNKLREELRRQTIKSKESDAKVNELMLTLNPTNANTATSAATVAAATTTAAATPTSATDMYKSKYEKLKKLKQELAHKCEAYENEIKALKDRITLFEKEDVKKEAKAKELYEKFKGRPGKIRFDDELLTVIDDYERQMRQLKRDIIKKDTFDIYHVSINEHTTNVRELIRSYERKIQEYLKRNKDLKNEIESLKTDLHTKEYRITVTNVASAENKPICSSSSTLSLVSSRYQQQQYQQRIPSSSSSSLSSLSPPQLHHPHHLLSTRLTDLKRQPASLCHKFLELTCSLLGVCDLLDIEPAILKLNKNSSTFNQLDSFVRDVHQMTSRYNLPRPRNKNCACNINNNNKNNNNNNNSTNNNNYAVCTDRHCLLLTLEHWVNQIKHLKNLQGSIKNLSEKMFPWRPISGDDDDDRVCGTLELVNMVDELVADGCHNRVLDASAASKDELVGIVRQFQILFEVPQVSGMYTRMSHLYRRLNENYNVMNNIKDVLGLDKSSNSRVVIDVVNKLVEMNVKTTEQHHQVQLQAQKSREAFDEEKEKLLQRLGEQEEFCSVFHETMQIIMQLLGVASVIQVVPSIERLLEASRD
ncbi:hypothetical protein HELRODRAFT_188678 [Helobdella robusta]|uniref:Centrosomal protein of 70 kDa n=1 Tax=Helobdella robusta TaxID=6412 RepID=T1FQ87_HELRO|nr:hypothetical protein HELRODRAFT_188678 [Helobdella robusta]ESO02374.1 hypothetical protein HELRODRAFT_188678 [Helobdella robusta]